MSEHRPTYFCRSPTCLDLANFGKLIYEIQCKDCLLIKRIMFSSD